MLYFILEGLHIKGLLLFLIGFLIAFFLITDFLRNGNPPNFPPGPWALPVVGNVFHINARQPHIHLTKLAKIYGNVFSIRLGRNTTVLVTGYKMMKEALVTQAENFATRPPSPMAERLYSGNGIFMSNGYKWKKQRRFALTTLKNFGSGRQSLESVICEESRFLQDEMEREKGNPIDPHLLLNNSVSNIICVMVFGHRFDYNDQNFQLLLRLSSEMIQLEGSIWGQLYEAFPTVMKFLPGPHNEIFAHHKELCAFVREEMEKHKEDWDPSVPRDYIDSFLAEIEHNKHDPEAGFNEVNLIMCTLDLFLAGTETTSTTLRWALLYMMKYPEIQEKIQAEIDRVIGQSRQTTMEDRDKMPYTDAVIHEIQRMGNIVPLNMPRIASKDTTLGKYFLPKGTTVLANLTSVMFDKTVWQTPDTFNPGHFLDSDGKFVRQDAFIPFSIGKRVCLGEHLAKMELFLFFVFIFQKFCLSPVPGEELNLKGQIGTTLTPVPFKICASLR